MKVRRHLVLSVLMGFVLLAGCTHQTATPTPISNKRAVVPSGSPEHGLVDINSAPKAELEALPGVGEAYAQRIIDHRPYREKTDLVRMKIIPESTYQAITEKIIAHHKQ